MQRDRDKVYGLFLVKLDRTTDRDEYVAAYGEKGKVEMYMKRFHLKGEVKEYKTKTWLVKRLEKLKEIYQDSIKLLYVE